MKYSVSPVVRVAVDVKHASIFQSSLTDLRNYPSPIHLSSASLKRTVSILLPDVVSFMSRSALRILSKSMPNARLRRETPLSPTKKLLPRNQSKCNSQSPQTSITDSSVKENLLVMNYPI